MEVRVRERRLGRERDEEKMDMEDVSRELSSVGWSWGFKETEEEEGELIRYHVHDTRLGGKKWTDSVCCWAGLVFFLDRFFFKFSLASSLVISWANFQYPTFFAIFFAFWPVFHILLKMYKIK